MVWALFSREKYISSNEKNNLIQRRKYIMMNKVEITKILVAIEVVIALVIIGLILYLRDPLFGMCYAISCIVITSEVISSPLYELQEEEEEL